MKIKIYVCIARALTSALVLHFYIIQAQEKPEAHFLFVPNIPGHPSIADSYAGKTDPNWSIITTQPYKVVQFPHDHNERLDTLAFENAYAQVRNALNPAKSSHDGVVIIGLSHGAGLALRDASTRPTPLYRLKAIIAESPMGITPEALGKATLNTPILIVHSSNDNVVPIDSSRLLYAGLIASGHRNAYLLELEEGEHGAYNRPEHSSARKYLTTVHAFYRKNTIPYDKTLADEGEQYLQESQPTPESIVKLVDQSSLTTLISLITAIGLPMINFLINSIKQLLSPQQPAAFEIVRVEKVIQQAAKQEVPKLPKNIAPEAAQPPTGNVPTLWQSVQKQLDDYAKTTRDRSSTLLDVLSSQLPSFSTDRPSELGTIVIGVHRTKLNVPQLGIVTQEALPGFDILVALAKLNADIQDTTNYSIEELNKAIKHFQESPQLPRLKLVHIFEKELEETIQHYRDEATKIEQTLQNPSTRNLQVSNKALYDQLISSINTIKNALTQLVSLGEEIAGTLKLYELSVNAQATIAGLLRNQKLVRIQEGYNVNLGAAFEHVNQILKDVLEGKRLRIALTLIPTYLGRLQMTAMKSITTIADRNFALHIIDILVKFYRTNLQKLIDEQQRASIEADHEIAQTVQLLDTLHTRLQKNIKEGLTEIALQTLNKNIEVFKQSLTDQLSQVFGSKNPEWLLKNIQLTAQKTFNDYENEAKKIENEIAPLALSNKLFYDTQMQNLQKTLKDLNQLKSLSQRQFTSLS